MKTAFKWLALLGCMSLSFGAGFLVAKKKFDDRDEQELEEIKKLYEQKYKEQPKAEAPNSNLTPEGSFLATVTPAIVVSNETKQEAKELIKDYTPEKSHDYATDIYVVSPLEYGEDPTYINESLTYYSDGILANDDDDSIIEDIDDVIGIGSLNHLGDYEEDYLYVKNDIVGAYYEVSRSDKTYSEVTGRFV